MSQQKRNPNTHATSRSQHHKRYCQAEGLHPGHHFFSDIHHVDDSGDDSDRNTEHARLIATPTQVPWSPSPMRSRTSLLWQQPTDTLGEVRKGLDTMLSKLSGMERDLAELEKMTRAQIAALEGAISHLGG